MLNIGDPKLLAYLRDLPSGYLLDLLADNNGIDDQLIKLVLQERGYTPEEVDDKVNRRRHGRLPRRPTLWRIARWASLFNACLVSIYNLIGFQGLMASVDTYRLPLVALTVLSAGFGFFLGFKLTTYIYQGSYNQLYCGFPVPIGHVNLETGRETSASGARLVMIMACNATVGVTFTVFPIILISQIVL